MIRYFSVNNIIIHNITSECTRTFTKDDEDDFNSFVITVYVSLLSLPNDNYLISLSTNNYVIINNYNSSKIHTVYTYPNQWLKYESTNQTSLNIYRKKEPYQRIELILTIGKSNEGTVTLIKEVEDSDKSISTVIISSSKPLSILDKIKFSETTSSMKSQIMFIGM
ncbi:protein kinase, putative [Entamoeba histolytica KU27]|uniref:Protein kinase, putative n=1 Tax=Entamoeba histolytica KU27 TaxID=885311 RepID=M2Q7M7_ENTHI|nr:protein kinase, putative [Entamoeba histolytica KU27]